MPSCCRGVTSAELPELLLMGQFFSSLGFHELLMLEGQLGILVELELLLLELQKAFGFLDLFLVPELRGGDTLPCLFQCVRVVPGRETGGAGQLWESGLDLRCRC